MLRFSTATKSLAAAVALLASGGTTNADILASGVLFGGTAATPGFFVCRIFNPGPGTVTIDQRRIYKDSGPVLAITGDNCNVPLAANKSCLYLGETIDGTNFSHSCKIRTVETGVKLRGTAEVQGPGPSHTVFATSDIR